MMKQNKQYIFEKLINNIIQSKKKSSPSFSYIKNGWCGGIHSNDNNPIPTVFYVGGGKTASTSLSYGFHQNNVAHWHGTKHFEYFYSPNERLLSNNNYDLYDLIIYIGKKYQFKPLIIEVIREPITRQISQTFHHLAKKPHRRSCVTNNLRECDLCKIVGCKRPRKKKRKWEIISPTEKNDTINELTSYIKNNKIKPFYYSSKDCYAINFYKKHFNIDIPTVFNNNKGFYFNNTKNAKLLILRYEDINQWSTIIKSIGYIFSLENKNISDNKKYQLGLYKKIVTDNIKFSRKSIDRIYNRLFDHFYNKKEKNKFIDKFHR